MSWNINLDTDGTWINGQWYSTRRINGIPRQWQYALGTFAQLSYVTEQEIAIIKLDQSAVRFDGPGGVDFYASTQPVPPFVKYRVVSNDVPYNWQSDINHAMAQLVYLTDDQIFMLRKADIYGERIYWYPHFGPLEIPSYQGDGGGAGDGSSTGSGPSADLTGLSISLPANPNLNGTETWQPGGTAYSYYGVGQLLSANCVLPQQTGLFVGNLSALGSLVAQKINSGKSSYLYLDQNGFRTTDITQAVKVEPYLTGYLREYWRDPTQTTLGANSAIPALTGVMPANLTPLSGSMLYYVDMQLTRCTGSNGFDNYAYINAFNQALNWVTTSNDYTIALNKAEANNLSYFGAANYQEFISQGFSRYQIGNALTRAIENIGSMVTEVPSGYFGTPNSVAYKLLQSGLGAIGDLSIKLINASVNFNDLYNVANTQAIVAVLETITDPTDLSVIQGVLKSTIPKMTNPMDYTKIDKASGIPNDSVFKTMAEFGADIYDRAPNLVLTTGTQLANIIKFTLSNVSPTVESLATNTGLLPLSIIEQFRKFLPVNIDNKPINILNVIGMASGYLTVPLFQINLYIRLIQDSPYGRQLINSLTSISNIYDLYINFEANNNANYYPAEYNPPPPPNPYANQLNDAKNQYLALLNTVAADPTLSDTVKKLNSVYNDFCNALYIEFTNYNRANLSISNFRDPSLIYSFVSTLPFYAADTNQIGTDYLLRQMCQPNQAGDTVKTILDQYKNNRVLNAAGVKIRGIL